jgi:nucleoside phosphorylase
LDNFVDFDLVNARGGDLLVFTGVGAGVENAEVSSLGDIILGLDSTAHTVSLTVQNNKIVQRNK